MHEIFNLIIFLDSLKKYFLCDFSAMQHLTTFVYYISILVLVKKKDANIMLKLK